MQPSPCHCCCTLFHACPFNHCSCLHCHLRRCWFPSIDSLKKVIHLCDSIAGNYLVRGGWRGGEGGGTLISGGGGLWGGIYQCTHERSIEEIDWGMEGKKSCLPTCNFVLTTQESLSEDPPSPLSPLPSFTLLLCPPQPNIIWIASINAPHILTPSFLIHFLSPPLLSHVTFNAVCHLRIF